MIEQHIQELTAAINRLTAACEKSFALSNEAMNLTTENNALAREAITLSLHAASGLTTKAPAKRKKGKEPARFVENCVQVIAHDTLAELGGEVSPEFRKLKESLAEETPVAETPTPITFPEAPAEWGTVTHIGGVPVTEVESVTPEVPQEPAAETPADPVVTVEDLKAYVLAAMEKTDAEGKKAINTKLFELNKELGVERVSFCPAEKCAEYLTAMKRWF